MASALGAASSSCFHAAVAIHPRMIEAAWAQAERGVAGRMEGHAGMDMSLSGGTVLSRALSERDFTPPVEAAAAPLNKTA